MTHRKYWADQWISLVPDANGRYACHDGVHKWAAPSLMIAAAALAARYNYAHPGAERTSETYLAELK